MALSWGWHSDLRTSVMSSSAHAMYLARRRSRGLLWLLLVAAGITFVSGVVCTVWLGYRHGAANLSPWWFQHSPRRPFDWAATELALGRAPSMAGWAWTGVGAVVMVVLIVAQRACFWWPLHPVGFIICSVIDIDWLMLNIFVAWFIKLVVVRVGGNRVYRMARRFFLGVILGQCSAYGVWAVVDTVFGKVGNAIG